MGSPAVTDNFFVVDSYKRNILLSFSKTTLTIKCSSQPRVECSLHQVLWAEVIDQSLHVSLLHRPKKSLVLYNITGSFDSTLREAAKRWSHSLMEVAYDGCQPKRRLKVMINPRGGPGRALSIFEKKVKPIFEAANCSMDVLVTERNLHCYDHIKSMQLDYDAIVLLSGDGLVHEVFNAFADREDALDAFAIPVVQVPTGSANGFSIALLGLKDGHDVCAAALNTIKGRHMKLDLCSVQQEGKRIISFMSQAIGMMADVDLGTENMRWMGDTRFMVGFLRAVGTNRACPMKLEVKVVSHDKDKMVENYRLSRSQVDFCASQSDETDVETLRSKKSMPLVDQADDEGWTVIEQMLSYVYAGKLPYVSRDLMQFPIAMSDDGLIDIVAQERISRIDWLRALDGAAQGKQYWKPSQLYFKAKAYRLTPYAENGHLAIDGESYPHVPFTVEVHPRLGTTLGCGGWHPEFCPRT
ncbi:hypothetical protein K439DRAFT_1636638 [Ramaria rubella]|nr:hypothetical protein K439DRAFT_1636638 [Ramaria rubella]